MPPRPWFNYNLFSPTHNRGFVPPTLLLFVIARHAKKSSPMDRELDCFVASAPRNDG
jgi:hypothetical protein